jgi:lysophospholipase L1-like esterase
MSARRWLPNLLLALGSVALFAAAAELAARAFDLRPAGGAALANPPWLGDRRLLRSDYRDEMAQAGILARYYDLYEWDRFLFYRLRAHAHVELLDPFAPPEARERSRWSVHTNARGFRGAEFTEQRDEARLRVAALGDSSTFGWGVEQFETYPERLAAELARARGVGPERVEVLNLGVPGYSTFQGRVQLDRGALPLGPDLVVWSYLSNDGAMTGESDQATYEQRSGPTGALLAWLHASRAFETLEAWIAVGRARLRTPAEPSPYDATRRNVPSYAAAAENVRGAVAAARDAGVPIVLLAQCVRGEPARVLAEVARETNTPFLDAPALLDAHIAELATASRWAAHREALRERYGAAALEENPGWLAYLPDRCHPNAAGHRLVAEALARVVDRALPGGAP